MIRKLAILCGLIFLLSGNSVVSQDPFKSFQQSDESQALFRAFEDAPEHDKEHALCEYVFFRLAHNVKALSKAIPGIGRINQFLEENLKQDIDISVRLVDRKNLADGALGLTILNDQKNSFQLLFDRELFLQRQQHLEAFIQFVVEHEITHVIQGLCGLAFKRNNAPITNHFGVNKLIIPLYFASAFPVRNVSSVGSQRHSNIIEFEADALALLFHPDKEGFYRCLEKRKTLDGRFPRYMQASMQKQWLKHLFSGKSYSHDEYLALLRRCSSLICEAHMREFVPINWQGMQADTMHKILITEANIDCVRNIIEARLQEYLYKESCYKVQSIPPHSALITTYHFLLGSDDDVWKSSFDVKHKTCHVQCGKTLKSGLAHIEWAVNRAVKNYFDENPAPNRNGYGLSLLAGKLFGHDDVGVRVNLE